VLCILLTGRRLELDHKFSGHPSAVPHLDTLRLGPLRDLSFSADGGTWSAISSAGDVLTGDTPDAVTPGD
jgi:hypothetical protein